MGREERIEKARRMAADRAPQREAEAAARAAGIDRELAGLDPGEAQRRVSRLVKEGGAEFLGPDSTPGGWATAISEARRVTIAAAGRGETITYGEIRLAVYLATGKLVGHSLFGRLVMDTNRAQDGVLISSIVVTKDGGTPGAGFAGFARSQGFDQPVETMQRHVFERFAGDT